MTNLETSYQSPLQVSSEEKPKQNSFFTKTAAFLAFTYLLNQNPSLPEKLKNPQQAEKTKISCSLPGNIAEAKETQSEELNAYEAYCESIIKKIDHFTDDTERPAKANTLVDSCMNFQTTLLNHEYFLKDPEEFNRKKQEEIVSFSQYLQQNYPEINFEAKNNSSLWQAFAYDIPKYLAQHGIYCTPMIKPDKNRSDFSNSTLMLNFWQIDSINSLDKNSPDYENIKNNKIEVQLWPGHSIKTNVLYVKPLVINREAVTSREGVCSFNGIANYQNVAIDFQNIEKGMYNSTEFFLPHVYQQIVAAGREGLLQELSHDNLTPERLREITFYHLALKAENKLPQYEDLIWQNVCHESGHINSMIDPAQAQLFVANIENSFDINKDEDLNIQIHQELEGKLAEYYGAKDITTPLIELIGHSAAPKEDIPQNRATEEIAADIIDECIDANGQPKYGFKRLFAKNESNLSLRDQIRFQFADFLDNPKLFKQILAKIHDNHLTAAGLQENFLDDDRSPLFPSTKKSNHLPRAIGGLGIAGAATVAGLLAWRRKRKMREKNERIEDLRKRIGKNGRKGKKGKK